MSRRGNCPNYGAYPTDKNGFAVPVEETRVPYIESERIEVHHKNYYKATFGKLAISQTFRDLKSQQELITSPSHTKLHQMYQGIQLPPITNMLDYIEEAQYSGDHLNVRAPRLGYRRLDIDERLMKTLYEEYNRIGVHL